MKEYKQMHVSSIFIASLSSLHVDDKLPLSTLQKRFVVACAFMLFLLSKIYTWMFDFKLTLHCNTYISEIK